MKKISAICKQINKLTDEEFTEADEMALNQKAYISPLKLATQRRTHHAGVHNTRVLAKLRELRDIIQEGNPKAV